jgi:molybdopterin synthase catalytic subunit
VRLARGSLSVSAAARELFGPGLGGVALFVGRVRPDRLRRGQVGALLYEVDPNPALARLRAIERVARVKFGAQRVVLWHRVGRVGVDEPSVIAGASCGHRAQAFAATRYLIEELKRSVPIWKEAQARPGRRPRPRPSPGRGR